MSGAVTNSLLAILRLGLRVLGLDTLARMMLGLLTINSI